jgi:hypothetical protein
VIDPNAWRYWYFWRRILLFAAGIAGLAGQMLTVSASQAQYLAFGVAVINLALSLIPDAAVDRVMPVDRYSDYRRQAIGSANRGDSGQVS